MPTITHWYLICGDERIKCSSEKQARENLEAIEILGVCKEEHRIESSTTESR